MGEVSETTARVVWNKARGLCCKCRRDVVPTIGSDPKALGKVAHIVARRDKGPRGDDVLDDAERNKYGNLLLLCGGCHDEVDAAPDHYTVAKLHSIKAEHEEYCDRLLTVGDERRAIVGEILANAVDLVVEGLSLERWDEWTSEILGPGRYRWPEWALSKEYRLEVRPAIYAVLWPKGSRALEVASKMLLNALLAVYFQFCSRSAGGRGEDEGFIVCETRSVTLEESRVERTEAEWLQFDAYLTFWDVTLELGMVHLAKCVNLFADAVRQEVNPRFRILEGAFKIEPCRFEGGRFGVYVFDAEEKERILLHEAVDDSADIWETVSALWTNPPLKSDYESPKRRSQRED